MKILTAIALSIVVLTGCASEGQTQYYDTQKAIANSNAAIAQAKYDAIGKLAEGGGDTARVAGIISLMSFGQGAQQTQQLAVPRSTSDTILQYLSVLAPVVVQGYGIAKNADVAINSSNNSSLVATSTNSTFLGMSGKIQAPAANVYNTMSGTGVMGAGSYSTDSSSHLSGTGVIGAGSYATSQNTLSGTGVLGTGVYNPPATVITPVVVTPVVVTGSSGTSVGP